MFFLYLSIELFVMATGGEFANLFCSANANPQNQYCDGIIILIYFYIFQRGGVFNRCLLNHNRVNKSFFFFQNYNRFTKKKIVKLSVTSRGFLSLTIDSINCFSKKQVRNSINKIKIYIALFLFLVELY